MSYGILKVDTITFTAGGVDTSVSISGLVQNPTFTGGITSTGTISGNIIQGGTTVSGATVTGTAGQFGTLTGNTAGFTTVTGATVTGTVAQFTTITGGTAGFTTVTGTTVTGTTANFATLSGATVTGNAGSFTTVTGGVATITSGVFAAGTEALPSISISSDPNTGIFSPGADQLAISTGGSGRLFVNSTGDIQVGSAATLNAAVISATANPASKNLYLAFNGTTTGADFLMGGISANANGTNIGAVDIYRGSSDDHGYISFRTKNGTTLGERVRITETGSVGIGTSAPGDLVTISDSTTPKLGLRTGTTQRGEFRATSAITSLVSYNSSPMSFIINDGTDKTAIYIDGSQRVGIGTSSPNTLLHISSPNNVTAAKLRVADSDGRSLLFESPFIGAASANIKVDGSGLPLAFYTDGSERARLTASGQWLVGTSTARSNFFNSASSESVQLQVEGTNGATCSLASISSMSDTVGGRLYLAHQRSGAVGGNTILNNGDQVGSITFQGNDGGQFVECASITALIDNIPGADDMPGRLVFSTTADGASAPTERMRITSNGRLDLWSVDVDAYGQFARMVRFGYGNPYKCLMLGGTETSSYTSISLGYNVASNPSGAFSGAGNEVVVRNDCAIISPASNDNGFAVNMEFNDLGHGTVRFPNGLGFGSDTSADNVLDDYEEGSWTPALSASGYTFTFPARNGRYTKIGNCVYVKFYMQVSYSSGSGSVVGNITGLPFTSGNVNANYGGFSWFPDVGSSFFANVGSIRSNPNSTSLLVGTGFNSAALNTSFNWANITANTEFEVSGFYFV